MSASRIIIFNPGKTKYLVGRESYFLKNIKELTVDMQIILNIMFSRKIKVENDSTEISYYSKQIIDLESNTDIMNIVSKFSLENRVTFGDIHYTNIDNQLYSYTLPQYVPKKTPYSFPGGQPKQGNTNISCAKRELYEETGLEIENLIHTNIQTPGYKLVYYILNKDEYAKALLTIESKNKSPQAELHDLKFINISKKISNISLKQYRSLTRKRFNK
jgi:hypothetical protein